MEDNKDDQVLRKLGCLELYHYVRSKLGFYNCVGMTAQYAVPSTVLQDLGGLEVVIVEVLKELIRKHPALGVYVIDEYDDKNVTWKRLKAFDLRQVLTFKTIHEDPEYILDEHQKTFDYQLKLPLWRVTIVNYITKEPAPLSDEECNSNAETIFDVGFFFSHAIGDGTSGVAFHLDFMVALNTLGVKGVAVDKRPEFVVNVPELSLLPPIDETPWPITLMYLVKKVFKTFVWSGPSSKEQWLGPPITFDPDQVPKTRMLLIFLDTATAGKILLLCRKEKTSITALLTFLIARRLALTHSDYSDFPASIVVSLRRFTRLTTHQMGDHVSAVQIPCSMKGLLHFDASKSTDWNTVREYRSKIHQSALSPKNQVVGLLGYAGNLVSYFKNKKRGNAFEVSNIGLVDGGMDELGIAKLRRLIFSQSANVTEDPYVFSIASVKNGDMSIALTWQEGILDEVKVRHIIDSLKIDLYILSTGGILESIS